MCSIHCVASTLGGQRCYKAFGRAFGRAFAELGAELGAEPLQGSVELSAELLQSFGRTQYFDVRHVDSATAYRALFFTNQSETGLAKFENWDTLKV